MIQTDYEGKAPVLSIRFFYANWMLVLSIVYMFGEWLGMNFLISPFPKMICLQSKFRKDIFRTWGNWHLPALPVWNYHSRFCIHMLKLDNAKTFRAMFYGSYISHVHDDELELQYFVHCSDPALFSALNSQNKLASWMRYLKCFNAFCLTGQAIVTSSKSGLCNFTLCTKSCDVLKYTGKCQTTTAPTTTLETTTTVTVTPSTPESTSCTCTANGEILSPGKCIRYWQSDTISSHARNLTVLPYVYHNWMQWLTQIMKA